jgi:hypothetical protein
MRAWAIAHEVGRYRDDESKQRVETIFFLSSTPDAFLLYLPGDFNTADPPAVSTKKIFKHSISGISKARIFHLPDRGLRVVGLESDLDTFQLKSGTSFISVY